MKPRTNRPTHLEEAQTAFRKQFPPMSEVEKREVARRRYKAYMGNKQRREKVIFKSRARIVQLKMEALAVYGTKCACCGEDIPELLTFHHKRGDGARHRAKDPSACNLPKWLKDHKYPKDFQVLCWNCNNGIRIGKGVCPHKMKRDERPYSPYLRRVKRLC